MTYHPEFQRPSDNEVENAAATMQIIEDTAKLCGLLAKAVMETTKDEHLAVKLIETAVLKAEKQMQAIGFDNTGDWADALESIRCCLIDWYASNEAGVEEAVNGGGKVQRGAGELGDTQFPSYLPDGLLSMACGVSSAAVTGSPANDRRRRLASLSR